MQFLRFIFLITVFSTALGAADQREEGLAACASLPQPHERKACEANVNRMAHCIGLEPDQRRQCIRETRAPAQPPDRCAAARNKERCERNQATAEVCNHESGHARAECEREQRPVTVPSCNHSSAGRQMECELYREAAQACSRERGEAARDCIDARWVVKLLKVHFNPLDCATEPRLPSLDARCAARQRVLRACAGLAETERRQCRLKYLHLQLEPLDCGLATDHRGSCLFHNSQLALCRGMEGPALDGCVSNAATQRSSAAIDCALRDLNPVEKRYCNAYDQALAVCMGHFNNVLPFRSCVDDAIPSVLKLAAIAAGMRRIGPVH